MRNNPGLTNAEHLLTFEDRTQEELVKILDLAAMFKDAYRRGVKDIPLLEGKTLAMMFFDSSLRTRVSFETAMAQLGGHALFLTPKTLHVGQGNESVRDTAEVLSRMADLILIRADDRDVMREFMKYSFCPVIDGGGLEFHSSQVVADLLTMKEHLPNTPYNEMKLMFIGDNNDEAYHFIPVQRSLMRVCAMLGIDYIACSPKELLPCQYDQDAFAALAEKFNTGAKMILSTEPYEVVGDADFIVTDAFTFKDMEEYTGMSDEEFHEVRWNMLKDYQINSKLLAAAKPNVGVMHCMPGNREEEITNEVWDGPNSLLFEEAENRLHAQKALCTFLMHSTRPSKEIRDYYKGAIEARLLDSWTY